MKSNMVKRILALMLALVMVLSLAACSDKADTTTEANQTEANQTEGTEASKDETEASTEAEAFDPRSVCEGVTITIAVASDDMVIDWNTNKTTLMIEEDLGVNLEFEVYASADYMDKINVMVNGGDKLPDIIFGDNTLSQTNVSNWAMEEVIIPLNEYYDNPDYAVNINKANERGNVNVGALMADADGKIWGMPSYGIAATNEGAYKLWINEEIVKKLGFDEVPTTTEGFYELCKAFVAAGDVDGDGKDDEVALTGRGSALRWFKMLMTPFVYAWDDYYLDVEDGELSFAYTTEGWKEGLKYIKKFIDEGLIDETVLTQNSDAYKAIVQNYDTCLLAEIDYYPQVKHSDKATYLERRHEATCVIALEGPDGRREAYYNPSVPSVGAVITADCENPAAAFLVCDYLCSMDMTISSRYGEQGVNWDYWENVDESKLPEGLTKDDYKPRMEGYEITMLAYNDAEYWSSNIPQNAGYREAGVKLDTTTDNYWGFASQKSTDGSLAAELQVAWNSIYYQSILDTLELKPSEDVTTLPMTGEESVTVNEIQVTLDNYVKESIGAFLTGQWDIDGYWDTYMAELEKIGVNDALAIYQTSYDRTK